MPDCEVRCISKPDRMSSHEHITHLGNQYSNPPWKWNRENVITSIEAGTNTFYVVDRGNGKRSEVAVVRPVGRSPYLRTHADGDWNDNLLALPSCP